MMIDDEEIILDTDLKKMQGIVSNNVPKVILEANGKLSKGEINPVAPWEAPPTRVSSVVPISGLSNDATWTAPESWGVRPHSSMTEELGEFPDEETVVAPRQTYTLRVFRTDSTFATMSCAAAISVGELLGLLAKKFFVPSGERWVLVHYHNNLARIMQLSERPALVQQKNLEKLGYVESEDGGGEMGRDDWSGFWRYVFMKADGLSTMADDVQLDQFQNVNLDSKNLLTIPLSLYRRASELLNLNISRNMSLSIPSDFIDSCINLHEIRFTHNEARRIPKAIPPAPALTHLDLSHNRLEDLDHIDLSAMHLLVSLKIANNKLKSIPNNIVQLPDLQILDLSSNYFCEFPLVICDLPHLSDLDLSFNLIETVPEEIGKLKTLSRFVITNNKLKCDFPASISEMDSLRELDCRFNALHNIDGLAALPSLESLFCGHNAIPAVAPTTGRFAKLKHFHMNKNPTTKVMLPVAPEPMRTAMTYLNVAGAKLSALDEVIFDALPNLERLILDDNAFTALPYIGKLKKLQFLHCANNSLQALPKEIGTMSALKYIDVHNNNLKTLPLEIWQITTLEYLNATSNLLDSFPKPPSVHSSISSSASTGGLNEELSPSPSKESIPASRKNSSVSVGRIAKILSQESSSNLRKDSSASTMTSRTANTIAQSLRVLLLGDNRLGDDCFEQVSLLTELRCLNVSYNEIYEIPNGALSRLTQLTEMYLSGNELTSLPADDLERLGTLKILLLNCNKLQTLPAELGKIRRLHVLDVGSNQLKYNINNWPYDWNWNWNLDLKYLSLSGNKRLEIKQQANVRAGERDLSDFHALTKLRLLGLMDVTTVGTTVPEQTENRRVRTIGSEAAGMGYGLADSLGKYDHLSVFDTLTLNFRGSAKEILLQIYDGQPKPGGGNRVAKYLQDNFRGVFAEELKKLKSGESVSIAFRRSYLAINKTLTDHVTHGLPTYNGVPSGQGANKRTLGNLALDADDLNKYGSGALTAYINGKTVTIANVGDSVAVLAKTTGEFKVISKKHRPGEPSELERIRNVGGSLTRNGKISAGFTSLDTSRAIGYVKYSPTIIAAPYVEEFTITDQDEFLILANNELWRCISYQTAVDVVRTERDDMLRAAHKLRDFGMAYGASGRLCVMVLRVGDLFHKKVRQPWSRNASASYNVTSGYLPGDEDGFFGIVQKKRKGKDELPEDSVRNFDTLAYVRHLRAWKEKFRHLLVMSLWCLRISRTRLCFGSCILLPCAPPLKFTIRSCEDKCVSLVDTR
jgi:adenylate cyclase